MSPTQNRRPSRHLALLVTFVAPLLSGACSQEPKPEPPKPDYGTGIVSLSEVQRFMATTHPPVPKPAPAPAPVAPEPPAAKVTTRAVASPVHARSRAAAPSAPAVAATKPAPEPVVVNPDVVASTIATPPIPVPPPATALAPTPVAPKIESPVPDVDDSSPIYSKDDRDVVPARPLTTQGGAGLGVASSDVNTMELVISKQGRVEQVKLSAPPKRMTDMLLLSGAKTWKFVPATKDGEPVRYRTQVSWETTR